MNRRSFFAGVLALATSGTVVAVVETFGADGLRPAVSQASPGTVGLAQGKPKAVLYRNPNCECCLGYAKYLRGNGFEVTVDSRQDLASIRKQLHVPESLVGCHVMVIGAYAVEGHVPVNTLNKLLAKHPDIIGISLPGMPTGTPGMGGPKRGPFRIYEIAKDSAAPKMFAVE